MGWGPFWSVLSLIFRLPHVQSDKEAQCFLERFSAIPVASVVGCLQLSTLWTHWLENSGFKVLELSMMDLIRGRHPEPCREDRKSCWLHGIIVGSL